MTSAGCSALECQALSAKVSAWQQVDRLGSRRRRRRRRAAACDQAAIIANLGRRTAGPTPCIAPSSAIGNQAANDSDAQAVGAH